MSGKESLAVGVPVCPEHPDSTVWRDGTYPAGEGRRQRFKCVPKDGPAHRFTWQPGPHARGFRYATGAIAGALVEVARGRGYREVARGLEGAPGGGNVVADWVELFAPIIAAELGPGGWPQRVYVGARALAGVRGGGERFLLQAGFGRGGAGKGDVLVLGAAPLGYRPRWREFAGALPGVPGEVVHVEGELDARLLPRAWPAARAARGPRSGPRGALTAALDWTQERLAPRGANLRNRERLNRLLALYALHLSGRADEDAFRRAIEAALARSGGAAPRRHEILDRRGHASLYEFGRGYS